MNKAANKWPSWFYGICFGNKKEDNLLRLPQWERHF